MDKEIFKEIGFTEAETKVYLALLEIGESTAGPILEKTGLQNSTLHKTLKRLVKDGYVSFVIKGKTCHYQATDPEYVLKTIEERKEKFQDIMPELKLMQKKVEKQHAEVYEGFRGFKNMVYKLIEDVEKGDEYLFFAFYVRNPEKYEYVFNFYREFDEDRHKKGLKIKGIAPVTLKDMIKQRRAEVLYVDFPVPSNIGIVRDKVIFTPWEDKMVSFMIHSRQLAESFRQLFYSIWEPRKKQVINYGKKDKKKN
ncbi:hypothetical protein H6503_06090 [Candidatus Woesearchaeota archaeon]|nr:hypothetical protein [Candidatus Woesearchaeota archaeon]